jgi:hypothetical protein
MFLDVPGEPIFKGLYYCFHDFDNMKGGVKKMLEFTWKVFAETGCIDTYLLFKELEKEGHDDPMNAVHDGSEIDFPIS